MSTTAPRYATHAFVLAVAMAVVVGSALGFEHIGGYIPCKLCLAQRVPYYAGIPVALLAALSATLRWPTLLTRGLLAVAGLAMAYALYLGVYHSGVEWHWWAGPADCGATGGGSVGSAKDLLSQLDSVKPPSCDEAAGRFLGLSVANAQVLTAAALMLYAFLAAGRSQGSSSTSQ